MYVASVPCGVWGWGWIRIRVGLGPVLAHDFGPARLPFIFTPTLRYCHSNVNPSARQPFICVPRARAPSGLCCSLCFPGDPPYSRPRRWGGAAHGAYACGGTQVLACCPLWVPAFGRHCMHTLAFGPLAKLRLSSFGCCCIVDGVPGAQPDGIWSRRSLVWCPASFLHAQPPLSLRLFRMYALQVHAFKTLDVDFHLASLETDSAVVVPGPMDRPEVGCHLSGPVMPPSLTPLHLSSPHFTSITLFRPTSPCFTLFSKCVVCVPTPAP